MSMSAMQPISAIYVVIIVALLNGAASLRATELRISPRVVQRGRDVTLECLYDLDDAPLYSVKWYRGRHEFYRYSPTEEPNTKIFPFSGINVDLANSNESRVVLQKVGFSLSGNFSCEVTADAPSFSTSVISNNMEVVAVPQWPPRISTEHIHYAPGDILRANCTSPPSRPQAILSLYLNEVPIRPGQLRIQQAGDGLHFSELSVAVQLILAHYDKGAPVLRCESSVGSTYREQSEMLLFPASGDPRIERVTSPGSSTCVFPTNTIVYIAILVYLIHRTIKQAFT